MEYVQRELPYVRSFVLRSVYGVLRQEGITFGEEEPGRVIAEWREDGTDVSLSITAEEKAFGTSFQQCVLDGWQNCLRQVPGNVK